MVSENNSPNDHGRNDAEEFGTMRDDDDRDFDPGFKGSIFMTFERSPGDDPNVTSEEFSIGEIAMHAISTLPLDSPEHLKDFAGTVIDLSVDILKEKAEGFGERNKGRKFGERNKGRNEVDPGIEHPNE